MTIVTLIELDPDAEIGAGMFIPHRGPVRVHGATKMGADCAIHDGCTIGAGPRPGGAVIGDHVYMGCHSSIIGAVTIGDDAMVAANSLVISDVPAGCTAIGVPAKILPVNFRGYPSVAAPQGPGARSQCAPAEPEVEHWA